MTDQAYNFAYLDEQTKRMIRRAILKGLAVPGYQVPFASREMPMPYGWGTGGVQVTAACLVPEDRLKVIDQGADDTTNAVSIRKFFQRTAGVATTEANGKGLRNKPGEDFVVFEVGTFEGFALSVKKAGSDSFTPARYQFANQFDLGRNANAVAFDLSLFGLADGEMITAIRIRNIFNSEAASGADKVDDARGQGQVLYPGDAGYDTGHTLTARLVGSGLKADEGVGGEFRADAVDADIVFVVGLHDIEKVDGK